MVERDESDISKRREEISLPGIGNIAHLPEGEDGDGGEPLPIGEKMERILHGGDDIPAQPLEILEEHNEVET